MYLFAAALTAGGSRAATGTPFARHPSAPIDEPVALRYRYQLPLDPPPPLRPPPPEKLLPLLEDDELHDDEPPLEDHPLERPPPE